MTQLLTLMTTGVTTATGAIAAYVFQIISSSPERITWWHCYLLLVPVPFIMFGMKMLTAHRDDIFKIGYYINVFFEERFSGPAWHIRLAHLRYMGESQDPAVYVAWTLFSFNSILFVISIFIWTKEVSPHALVIVPVFFVMLWQSKQFLKNRDYIKDAWIDVRNNEG